MSHGKKNAARERSREVLEHCKQYFRTKYPRGVFMECDAEFGRRVVTSVLLSTSVDRISALFIGHAICSPQDTFDPIIGREIAFRRALRVLKGSTEQSDG